MSERNVTKSLSVLTMLVVGALGVSSAANAMQATPIAQQDADQAVMQQLTRSTSLADFELQFSLTKTGVVSPLHDDDDSFLNHHHHTNDGPEGSSLPTQFLV